MKKKLWFALSGIVLLGLGFFLLNLEPYRPLKVISSPASCRMAVDVVEPITGSPQGYAILFHGVSANRRLMSYIAQDLANQSFRVFVPDSPGHGKTPGPFSPLHASDCGEALVRELIDRRAIVPERTILIGHSMEAQLPFAPAITFLLQASLPFLPLLRAPQNCFPEKCCSTQKIYPSPKTHSS